jgi:hypothetical protein
MPVAPVSIVNIMACFPSATQSKIGLVQGRFDPQLIADLGNRCAFQKVPLESSHLFGDRKMTTRLLGHGKIPPFRLC